MENVAYVVFYRSDGNGVPFALLPVSPIPAVIENGLDNWKCRDDFSLASVNQAFSW